jgi:hypothetical protein
MLKYIYIHAEELRQASDWRKGGVNDVSCGGFGIAVGFGFARITDHYPATILMRHFTTSTLGLAVLTGFALISPATAALVTEYFTYSGAAYSNTAVATGWITFDADVSQPFSFYVFRDDFAAWTGNEAVKDLSITVAGATSGNGTFDLNDMVTVGFSTNGVALDFTKDLVGQTVPGDGFMGVPEGPWGTAFRGSFQFKGPDESAAPHYSGFFELTTGGGAPMQLTSMTPIPEVTSSMLVLVSSGLLLRRRTKPLR